MARNRKIRTRVPGFGGRALHLIDAENVGGGPNMRADDVRYMWTVYRTNVATTSSDQFWIGSSRRFLRGAIPALSGEGARVLVRDGRDGGESILIDNVDVDHVADRYDRVVIASGDGAFEGLTLELRARGVHVQVVNGYANLSRALRRAASTVTQLKLTFADPIPYRPDRTVAAPTPALLAARSRQARGLRRDLSAGPLPQGSSMRSWRAVPVMSGSVPIGT
ncbi:NYN domain-containing protein [Ruania rhizosphaerae]|uniref:NYN domain-containing protein n=1 Tax=Ruania rhizosphaerae TaxID=1840413 RepID=UPI00135ACD76|nr:NYN domain-containing protein [Ruania rhizosphaerae]